MNSARISRPTCSVKIEPNHHCEASSELLFGEAVQVMAQDEQWCRISSVRDGYEGFVETDACDFQSLSATHWVSTRATFIFKYPDIKAPVVQRLLFGSELTLSDLSWGDVDANRNFLKLGDNGFVWSPHCTNKNTSLKSSMIDIAQNNYLNAPYLWGGRSSNGCDCSGLVQMVAMARGVSLPRDSVDQEAALNSGIEYESRVAEDLVFWPGHVGLLKSPDLLLHSTAHSLRCCIEPIADVMLRAGFPSSIKRIQSNQSVKSSD